MNRSLMTFATLAIAALVGTAASPLSHAATVDVSLNVFYTSPANPSLGGTYSVVAKTTHSNGLAALRFLIDYVDSDPSAVVMASGIGAIDPIDAGGSNVRPPFVATANGIDGIYGQDISASEAEG